ncbi:hypothetical protein CCR75_003705 [Bremia lactucae]|uniref:WW domain-containing protein n=1 Tax=Bremia lactucae TaxID=4779 RepID=A0A976IJU0_BRELC|nr:hypothetical protein CCR75_003705 [Bremia lactucae]
MTTTTTTGHPQMELSSSSVPRRRHPLYRGDMRTRDTQDPRFPARTHMQQGYTGYDGQYLQQCQGIIKPGQFHGMLKPSKANVPQRNEPPTRQHRAATSEIVRKRSDYVVRDEDLVGRPAMIALHQDDLQFDDVTELPRADRIDYGHKSRGSNQSDTLHGNSKSGTFHGNSKSGGFRGNCKSGGFRGNCKSSIPATKATTRQSRPRSGTTDNQVSREPQMVVAPIQGSSRSVQNDVSSLASGPAPLTSEPVAWRVALDPKSKKPYYYHRITRETTWKKPAELIAAETHEKRQFFNVMENNIRLKLRDGFYLRESDNTFVAGLHSPNTGFHLAELSSTLSTLPVVV